MALYGEIPNPPPPSWTSKPRGRALVRSWPGSNVSRPTMPGPLTPIPPSSSYQATVTHGPNIHQPQVEHAQAVN